MLMLVLLFQLVNSQRGLVKSFKIFKSCIQRGGWTLLEHTHTHTHTQHRRWHQMNQWSPTTPGSLVMGSKLWSWTEPPHSVIPSTTLKSRLHVSSFTVRKWSKKIGPSERSVFSRFRLRNRFTPAHGDLFLPATSSVQEEPFSFGSETWLAAASGCFGVSGPFLLFLWH